MASIAAPRVSSQARWLVALIGIAIFINYVDRGNIATAGPSIKAEMQLSNTQFGLLVSAFFWTYVPGQIAAGWLAQRYDAYRLLAGGLGIWAVATMAMGLAGGFVSLFVLRVVLGIGESVAFPCASKLIADHVPPERFGAANSVTALGLTIGPAFGIYAGGLFIASYGWRESFILFGVLSLLWLIPWLRLPRDTERPHASSESIVPLADIVRTRAAWGAAIGHFCLNYSFYFILAWLPLYLVKVHGFSLVQMAQLGGIIYLVQGASAVFFGWLPDRMIARGATSNHARKTMMVAGSLITGMCMIVPAFGSASVAIGALIASAAFFGMTGSNCFASGQTIAGPRAAGTFVGFQNAVGNMAGLVAPALTGYLVDVTGGFSVAFVLAAIIALGGALSWGLLVGRIEPLCWDRKG